MNFTAEEILAADEAARGTRNEYALLRLTTADAERLLDWGSDARDYGTWLGGLDVELWNRIASFYEAQLKPR